MSRRLLLIAYYFPPLGLSGVQRVLKWAKYLPDSGWDVTVLTVRPAAYFARDETLLDDLRGRNVTIVRTRSIDPTRWMRTKRVALPEERRRRLISRVSQTIFQPDNKIGWYPFAVAAGKKLLSEEPFDAIYSSAPPYTAHLVGAALSRRFSIPLFLEYRDDWIENPRHHYATSWHKSSAIKLENSVFAAASGIVTINEPIRSELSRRGAPWIRDENIRVFPHGFDPDDLERSCAASANGRRESAGQPEAAEAINFVYSGIFYDMQKPDTFLRGLAGFIASRNDSSLSIRATFIGLVPSYLSELVSELGLEGVVRYDGYLNHAEAILKITEADVLWMTVGDSQGAHMISTSKLYEYFGTGKPILGLVPDGTARAALREYGAAELVKPGDVEGARRAIACLYDECRQNRPRRGDPDFIQRFNRKSLAAELALFLDDVCDVEKRGGSK